MSRTLYVEPESNASKAAAAFRTAGATVKADAMDRIGKHAQARWLSGSRGDVTSTVDRIVTTAGVLRLAVFVAYWIPQRDGDDYSKGGAPDTVSYWRFIAQIARGLHGREAIVILEPDATAHADFLSDTELDKRLAMMAAAVDTLTAAAARVYIDAGSFNWIPAATIAPRLLAAGVERAAGFSLNVSDSETTENGVRFAEELRALLKAKGVADPHYVIDVSRNGAGPPKGVSGEDIWCNPPSLRLGKSPTLSTGIANCDGLLRIKRPGESDGECNGGPKAGTWSETLALKLAGA